MLLFVLGLLVLGTVPVLAQEGALGTDVALDEPDIYQASLRALTVLFVVAILIENALALVFNWKVYRAFFSERGLKPIASFVVSLIVVQQFGLDIVASLLDAYGEASSATSSNLATEILTAMIVAGGSSGVNTVMRSLGYRSNQSAEVAKPPKDKAWIAVRVDKGLGKGAMQISVTEDNSVSGDLPAIAGTVMKSRPTLTSLLTRNTNRFPANGGYEVVPNKTYRISLIGEEDGEQVVIPVGGGPVKLAPRAIVDFDVTVEGS